MPAIFILLSFFIISCGQEESRQEQYLSDSNNESSVKFAQKEAKDANDNEVASACPNPDGQESFIIEGNEEQVEFIDLNREIKDIGTKIVVESFFNTPDTLYNFMKFVYQTIDSSLNNYKNDLGLNDKSITLLFKGGNVLRMIANGFFEILTPKARYILTEKYNFTDFFKRSDADFAVYVNYNMLKDYSYDIIIDEVAKVTYKALNKIREEFEQDPQRYFAFLRYKSDYATKDLWQYFRVLPNINAIIDESNEQWFDAKFSHIQFLNESSANKKTCGYTGQFDYKFDIRDKDVVATKISDTAHWIVNSDNRTLEWPWGSDPSKMVKFYLVRAKVPFDYYYEKDGQKQSKTVGGELIDVAISHKKDDDLGHFLEHFDDYLTKYTLSSKSADDSFDMNAYSILYLAYDLNNILFYSFVRPWEGGRKYHKRLNRLFLLFFIDMAGDYGIGSNNAKSYWQFIEQNILPKLKMFDVKQMANNVSIKEDIEMLKRKWPEMDLANYFLQNMQQLVEERIAINKLATDEEGLKDLLEVLQSNIKIALELTELPFYKITPDRLYKVDLKNLF